MIRRCRTRQPTPSRSSLAISQRARHTPGPGCASVGTLVVLSAGLLVLGVPDDVLPDSTSWALTDVAWLVLLVGLYVALSALFDLLGGLVLPRRYGRPLVAEGFSRNWARGAAVHGYCLLVVALVLLAAGRAGGDGAALAAASLLMAGLLAAQCSRLPGTTRPPGCSWCAARPSGGAAPARLASSTATPADVRSGSCSRATDRAIGRLDWPRACPSR